MDRQLIKSLIDALQASALSELEYTAGGATLRLSKAAGPAPARVGPPAPEPARPPLAPKAATGAVAAPLFGVVHLAPSPGAAPIVRPGDAVAAGAALCTIEAMKVFTEVRAPADGTVEAVLVEGGHEVEPGQTLMVLA